MERLLLEIIKNSNQPVLITTENIQDIVDAVFKSTKIRIYFKFDVWVYFTDEGYTRQRKAKNTYEVWIKQDVTDLQEADLKHIRLLNMLR